MTDGAPPRRWLPNLALLCAALAVTLLALEIGVRLFVDMREHAPIPVLDVDPERPTAFLPGRERVYETGEFRYHVSFNRFGRRDVEWTRETIADPGNLLFVGDSFVLGNGVEDADSIPTLLEGQLAAGGRAPEVFNFGMPAGAPPVYLELLRDALDAGIAAQTVLVGLFVGNDFDPDAQGPLFLAPPEARPAPSGRWRPRSALARFLRLRVSRSPRLVGWALGLSSLMGISLYDSTSSYIFLRRPTAEQLELFDSILAHVGRMQELCREHGRLLRVVIFPNKIQVENADALTNAALDAERPNRRILEFCRRQGLACLDLLPPLRQAWLERGEALYFPIDRHLNPAGTRVAAGAIGPFLAGVR